MSDVQTGRQVGPVTKGAIAGGASTTPAGILIAWVLVKYGVESDPATAAVLGGAVTAVFMSIGTLLGGKFTPSQQGSLEAAATAAQFRLDMQDLAALLAAALAPKRPEHVQIDASPGAEAVPEAVGDPEAPTPPDVDALDGGVWGQLGRPDLDAAKD
ncbi:hypothetical protein [Kocuria sp.]|uniref:hypothetical protein n=1 Tax=Kocuria sp. TaxID=1871328 RepID=UPI0026E0FACF|nr:hypothetical protein [Kocuria sp.]MDO5619254.1 hypothetical protein [Kocuria sp.]